VGVMFVVRWIVCAGQWYGSKKRGTVHRVGRMMKLGSVSIVWVGMWCWRALGIQRVALVHVLLSIICAIMENCGCVDGAVAVVVSGKEFDWV